MSNLRVLCRDNPQRTIALVSSDHALVFHHTSTDTGAKDSPRCQVEFLDLGSADLDGYRPLGIGYGTLGLVTLNEDVFVCVVTGSSQAATVRPGEIVSRIDNVGFCESYELLTRGPEYCANERQIALIVQNMSMVLIMKLGLNSPQMIVLAWTAKIWLLTILF